MVSFADGVARTIRSLGRTTCGLGTPSAAQKSIAMHAEGRNIAPRPETHSDLRARRACTVYRCPRSSRHCSRILETCESRCAFHPMATASKPKPAYVHNSVHQTPTTDR